MLGCVSPWRHHRAESATSAQNKHSGQLFLQQVGLMLLFLLFHLLISELLGSDIDENSILSIKVVFVNLDIVVIFNDMFR